MKSFIFCICLLFSNLIQAQLYGNEWINFSQDYYKIKIGKEGIYKIDYNTLNTLGFPLNTINPKNIQLWINGQEQPIIVSGEDDSRFDSNDYIEFYGTYNDGKLDAPLYPNPAEQPHQYMSLYSDTATYFLTVSSSNSGKRVIIHNDTNYNGKTSDPYYMFEQSICYKNQPYDGLGYGSAGFHSEYNEGEGWAYPFAGGGMQFSFQSPSLSSLGPKPYLEGLAHSRANNINAYDINGNNNGLQLSYSGTGGLISEKRVNGLSRYFFQDSLDKSYINAKSTTFTLNSFLLAKSNHSVSFFKLTYPRLFSLNDSSKIKFNYKSSNVFIKFSEFAVGYSNPIIYDLYTFTKSIGTRIGGELLCNLSSIGTNRLLYILDEILVIKLNSTDLKAYKFNQKQPSISNDYLIITHQKLDSGAKAYSNFLESTLGGSFKPYIAYTSDIYDQFYYGLKHPEAFKNLIRFCLNQSQIQFKYLLLLGKGHVYSSTRFNRSFEDVYNLVPSYGNPPSDYYFTTGFNGSILDPLIPTGRIPAKSNHEIKNYLQKISSNNQIGYQDWKKRILQLGGGATTSEVTWFSSILNNYHTITKQPFWGASRLLFTKSDPSTVDSSLTDKIQYAINEGYSLIDYFGHGATEATDVSLGNPKKLKNQNKYPVFYLNGCALGNVFNGNSLAEDYLFGEEKGAIGWLAGTAFGDVSSLDGYSKILHSNLTKYPNNSITKSIAQTIKTFQSPASSYNKAQCRQMLFLGEPSLVIFNANKPDYTLNKSSFEILPKDITADADSFIINLRIDNLALATYDSLTINIYQKYPNNKENLVLRKRIENVPNNKNFEFWIRINKMNNIAGLNYFTIHIDSGNLIDEQLPNGEFNNQITVSYFFPSNRALTLFPCKNGIVSNNKVTLMAQLLNESKDQKIIFELDTTNLFNSPKKQTNIVNNSSILKVTDFILMPFDSIDYYWRVKVDDGTQNNSWDVSTFSLIYDSPSGWSQGYWQKFMDSKQDNMRLSANKNVDFLTYQSNKYDLYSGKTNPNAGCSIWQSYHPLFFGYFTQGITLTAINSKNEDRYITSSKYSITSSGGQWWPVATEKFFYKYYEPKGIVKSGAYGFNTTLKEDRDSLVYFLNHIPNNYYLMATFGYKTGIESWEDTIFKAFEQFGAMAIKSIGEGEPYTLVSKRNAPVSSVYEKTVDLSSTIPPTQQNISFSTYLDIIASKGKLISNPIGPASKWRNMYTSLQKSDSDSDKVTYEIFGITKTGTETLLINNIGKNNADLSLIDAKVYPFIKIIAFIKDSINKTPQIIKRWTVLYDGIPEGMVNPNIANFIKSDTLYEGDSLHIKISYQNISKFKMDSILVTINEINSNKTMTQFYSKKFKPLLENEYLIIDQKIPTENKSNKNSLQIIFNPNNEQPELYSFNNNYQFNYHVINDTKNPYLDVVFDGRHITNHEIISPSPVITITATDENKFFYLNEPSYFKVKLKNPGNSNFRELDLTNDTFTFIPSKGPNDISKLVFSPLNLRDGIHELLVSVRDAKGNFSSAEDFNISFRIITKSTLTNIYPYPNPFSSKTKFIFTLTGEKIPEYFKISIISVSGVIVKEITLDEIGAINIGNNMSKYEWDGTDTYGDKLANGVYLYKVTAKLNGKDIEISETAGDAYFKKGYGKLYIMR